MIKFESCLAINDNNNENNTAIIENYTSPMTIFFYLYSFDLKKITKVVSCCIICDLITKSMPCFDEIKDKVVELHFKCDMAATRP